jgi:hypothetical protein
MVKTLALGAAAVFGVAIVATLGFAATKPDTFHVERTLSIHAPADKIAAHIDDYRQWAAWSPFEKLDPKMQRTFSGPARGKGAVYAWSGDDHAGTGHMAITEEVPGAKITMDLDFEKPMPGHSVTEFTFVPHGDSTDVTWSMSGPQPYIGKVMCLFVSMDAMIGKSYEEGLANLKAIAEK